jgi:hypothetical protein
MTSIGVDIGVKGKKLSFFGDSNLPLAQEWVTLTGCQNVFITIQHTSNWSSGLVCGNGTDSSQLNGA